MSRTSSAYMQKTTKSGVISLFETGANWTRRELIRDPVSGLVLPGIRLEPERENLLLRSQELNTAAWTKTRLSVTADSAVAPDGTTTIDTLHEDNTAANSHYISRAASVTNAKYTVSGYFQKDNRDWVIFIGDAAAGGFNASFDLDSGVEGTASNCTTKIHDLKNGAYRCEATFTPPGSASGTYYVCVGEADNDITFDGLDQDSVYAWGLQLELGEYASSYIPTEVAAVTRTADSALIYDLSTELQGKELSLSIPVVLPEYTPSADVPMFKVYDASGAGTDYLLIAAQASTGYLKVTSATSGGDSGSCVVSRDICDGRLHWLHVSWMPGTLMAWADNVPGTPDHVVSVPGGLDTAAYQVSGGVSGGVEIIPEYRRYPFRPLQPQLVF